MTKSIRIFFSFIGVWLIGALINGASNGIVYGIVHENTVETIVGNVFLICVVSLVLGAPLVALVWFITMVADARGKSGHSLFQITLKATLIFSFIAAVVFVGAFGNEFEQAKYTAGFCIVFSAVSSVLLFRNNIKMEA